MNSWRHSEREKANARRGLENARAVLDGEREAPPAPPEPVLPPFPLTASEVADVFTNDDTDKPPPIEEPELFDVTEMGPGRTCKWCRRSLDRARARRSNSSNEYCDEKCRGKHRRNVAKSVPPEPEHRGTPGRG